MAQDPPQWRAHLAVSPGERDDHWEIKHIDKMIVFVNEYTKAIQDEVDAKSALGKTQLLQEKLRMLEGFDRREAAEKRHRPLVLARQGFQLARMFTDEKLHRLFSS